MSTNVASMDECVNLIIEVENALFENGGNMLCDCTTAVVSSGL